MTNRTKALKAVNFSRHLLEADTPSRKLYKNTNMKHTQKSYLKNISDFITRKKRYK